MRWSPLPGPQTLALESEADELFYGGAAGGGKTDLLLGAALTRHRKSIIFRRQYPQLKDIVLRMNAIIGSPDYYNKQEHIAHLPDGRMVELGAVNLEDDREKYKGRAHDLKGFDELADFTRSQYRFLIAWNRTTEKGQRTRVISTGNPPSTPEGEWIVEYWGPWLDPKHPNPAKPGELRWYATIDGKDEPVAGGSPLAWKGETIRPRSRTFVPARVEDNPYLMATDYTAVLDTLPEPLRSMLRYGNFAARAEDHPWQLIPTSWVRAAMERWRNGKRPDIKQTSLGVDVARGGADKMVIAKRYGAWFDELVKVPGALTPDGDTAAQFVLREHADNAPIMIDVIGIGSSAYDVLRKPQGADGAPLRVIGVNASEKSFGMDKHGRFKMRNMRAEMYWQFREALDPQSGQNIALPEDRELFADLCSVRYEIQLGGIQIENKDEIRKRIGRSPDCGDAVVLAGVRARSYGF